MFDQFIIVCVWCVFQDEVAHTLTENRVLQNSKHPFLTVRDPPHPLLCQSVWKQNKISYDS